MNKLVIIDHTWENPWKNLAYETCLLNYIAEENKLGNKMFILFLWQNNNTIVIGRNQNPWKEFNIDKVKENKVNIARRITGGGAVFHDLGNLNFSFIVPEDYYDVQTTSNIIVNAVNKLGIPAELSGRNDILSDKKKFSGNAYHLKNGAGLHHGTILISADQEKIANYLTPNKIKLKSKGIESVKSRITNLKNVIPTIDVKDVKESIKKAFKETYGDIAKTVFVKNEIKIDERKFRDLEKEYSSDEWIYGSYKNVDNNIVGSFSWGNLAINFYIEHNIIQNCTIETDSLENEIIILIQNRFIGHKLSKEESLEVKRDIVLNNSINCNQKVVLNDIIQIILNNIR